ncbi:MAG: hypothetical protein ACLVAW_26385 [Eisenbergiella massiliensis]
MSRITVRTENKRFPTAPNLYGIFFEDINRAGDGGLYPELLRNRSFEDSIEPKDCHTEQDGYALVSRAGWRDEFNHGRDFRDGSGKTVLRILLFRPGTQITHRCAWTETIR